MFAVLFATGVAWWLVQRAANEDEISSAGRAALPWLLKIHGAAAMVALVILGVLYPLHVVRGWRVGRNQGWGISLAATCVALVATGYLLYYSGSESLRAFASNVHLGVGLALPAVVAVHIWRGRQTRAR